MAPRPSLSPPCQTADPLLLIFIGSSPCAVAGMGRKSWVGFAHPPAVQADLSSAGSAGGLRRRLPVAAKIAFMTAGTIAEVPDSPIPPGRLVLLTIWTSMTG